MRDKFNTLIHIMISVYNHLSVNNLHVPITFDIDGIRYWLENLYPIDLLTDNLYILPEPYAQRISFNDNDICNTSDTIINRYFNSTIFGFKEPITNIYQHLYDAFIRLEMTPFYGFNITQYQIFQIVDVNKRKI